MVKTSSVVAFFAIVLLSWYGIHAVAGLLLGVPLYASIFLCVALIPFILLLVRNGVGSLVEWKILPALLIWLVYTSFFLFHAKQFPGIASQLGLLNTQFFVAQTLESIVITAVFRKEIVDMELFLYRLYVTVSLLSVLVRGVCVWRWREFNYLFIQFSFCLYFRFLFNNENGCKTE